MPKIPPVTRAFLIACIAVFCLQQFPVLRMELLFALWPVQAPYFWPGQLLSYAFLHGNASHLFFNMLGLWMFGLELEEIWGTRRFVQFMLACALSASLVFLLMSGLVGSPAPAVGASGILFGMLFAFGMLFPRRPILMFFVFQTNMRTAVILYGVLQVVLVLSPGLGFLTNLAHLGGMLGAWAMILWWRHRPPSFRRKKK